MDSPNVFIGSRVKSDSSSACLKEQHVFCCCTYDPCQDDSPESRIQDLSFALKKLSVMKCQMRKWQLERLQLESQTRSLKAALLSYGVDVNKIVKADPLISHFRKENLRLQKLKDELEDQVRDLNKSRNERNCSNNNSCDSIAHLREKLRTIRHRHAIEKRQLRETITNLQLRLQEMKDEKFGVALNRLRAKLQELMKDEKKGYQQVSYTLEKSIETLVELSKSCDELRKENESLVIEVETLKKELKEDDSEKIIIENNYLVDDLDTKEMSNLYERIKTCECLVSMMRLQLKEKDDMINDLQKKVSSEKILSTKAEAMNSKPKEEDTKNIMDDPNNENSSKQQENDESTNQLKALKERLEKVFEELNEERYVNESLKKKVEDLRQQKEELQAAVDSTKQDIVDIKAKMDSLCADNAKLEAELESFTTESLKLNKCANNFETEIDVLTKEKVNLMHELEYVRHNEELTNKQLEVCRQRLSELQSILANVSIDKERLEREVGDFKWQLNKLKKDLEVELVAKNEIEQKFESTRVVLNSLTTSNYTLVAELCETKKNIQSLEQSKSLLSVELNTCKSGIETMVTENTQLKSDNDKLKLDINKLKIKSNNAWKQLTTMKNEIKKLQFNNNDSLKSVSKKIVNDKEIYEEKLKNDNRINDFIRASEALKAKMEIHLRAVDIIRTFIGYAEGSITKKPEISSELSACEYDRKYWLIPQINQLFETSQKLSETILKAEQEVRYLGDLKQKEEYWKHSSYALSSLD